MAGGLFWASVVLAVIVSVFALDIMGLFSRKNHLEVDGKVRYPIFCLRGNVSN